MAAGSGGAGAVADVLTGAANPGGKLPSHPRHVEEIPPYHGHKTSGGRSQWKGDYVGGPVGPLYAFGHGLSYTSIELLGVSLDDTEATWSDEVHVRATVANTGDREGDEVVQLHTRDRWASVTLPVLEPKSFARVTVPAGSFTVIPTRKGCP